MCASAETLGGVGDLPFRYVGKMIEDGKTLQALVTVTDPGAFNMPWSGLQRWRRVTDRPIVENLCAENNANPFGYDRFPIPQTTKPDF